MAEIKIYERRLGGSESYLRTFNVKGRIEVESFYYDEDEEYRLETIDTIVAREMETQFKSFLRDLNG